MTLRQLMDEKLIIQAGGGPCPTPPGRQGPCPEAGSGSSGQQWRDSHGVKDYGAINKHEKKVAEGSRATGFRAVKEFFKTNDIDIIWNRSPEDAMRTLIERTGIGHGVEHIPASEFKRTAKYALGLSYVNMGDPYTTTLMHTGNASSGQWFIGNWGDVVEKYGKQQK